MKRIPLPTFESMVKKFTLFEDNKIEDTKTELLYALTTHKIECVIVESRTPFPVKYATVNDMNCLYQTDVDVVDAMKEITRATGIRFHRCQIQTKTGSTLTAYTVQRPTTSEIEQLGRDLNGLEGYVFNLNRD